MLVKNVFSWKTFANKILQLLEGVDKIFCYSPIPCTVGDALKSGAIIGLFKYSYPHPMRPLLDTSGKTSNLLINYSNKHSFCSRLNAIYKSTGFMFHSLTIYFPFLLPFNSFKSIIILFTFYICYWMKWRMATHGRWRGGNKSLIS